MATIIPDLVSTFQGEEKGKEGPKKFLCFVRVFFLEIPETHKDLFIVRASFIYNTGKKEHEALWLGMKLP